MAVVAWLLSNIRGLCVLLNEVNGVGVIAEMTVYSMAIRQW